MHRRYSVRQNPLPSGGTLLIGTAVAAAGLVAGVFYGRFNQRKEDDRISRAKVHLANIAKIVGGGYAADTPIVSITPEFTEALGTFQRLVTYIPADKLAKVQAAIGETYVLPSTKIRTDGVLDDATYHWLGLLDDAYNPTK